jgi:hypothetical protein
MRRFEDRPLRTQFCSWLRLSDDLLLVSIFAKSIFLRTELAMVRLVRFVVPGLLPFGTTAQTQSTFLTYEQWEQLPTTLRESYVAGAVDQLSTVGVPAGLNSAKHYNECIVKSGMRLGQIAEGMKKFMEMRSDLRQKPAPRAVMEYLITLCGLPTPSEGALPKRFSSAEG